MDENPYQSPTTVSRAFPTDGGFRVEGKLLVVVTGAVLPPICVKTNRPVSQQDLVTRQYSWCSSWWAFLILVSGLLLVLVYFLVRKKCTLTFGLDPAVKRKYRLRNLAKVVAVIALFFALPFVAGTNSMPAIVVVLLLFLGSIVALLIGNSALSVTKYRNGEFWLHGCSFEFLDGLQSQQR